MASSPSASPRRTTQAIGLGDRSPSAQRRSKLRRRSSNSDSSSSGDDPESPLSRKSGGGQERHDATATAGGEESKEAKEHKGKVTLSPTLLKLTRSIKTMVDRQKSVEEKKEDEKKRTDDESPNRTSLSRKVSVAALIRSFSPRSRAKANKANGGDTELADKAADDGNDLKTETKRRTTPHITFGTLKRASLSFPTSPQQQKPEPRRASLSASGSSSNTREAPLGASLPLPPPPSPPADIHATQPNATPTNSITKWKEAVNAVAKNPPPRLKIQIPPLPPTATSPASPSVVEDESFATGPGSLVDDVRATLDKLVELLDGVDPRKLRTIRLGGELRGLLGKAADEVEAYAAAFREHALASVGVAIALQNLAASLRQVFPIVEKLRTAKFMLNRQFKRDVTFAFQEINSYYTSVFMELSMAVATRAGLVLPMPTPVAPPVVNDEAEEAEEVIEKKVDAKEAATQAPSGPPEPTGEELCLAAHRHFFGHACPVDLPRALTLYQQAAAAHCFVAMRCLGHMYMLGQGVEKDWFVAEQWLTQAASSEGGDVNAWYLLGCLQYEKAPHQKTALLTRECLVRAQNFFTLAAERGLADAQIRLAELLERRDSRYDDDYRDRIHAALPWYRRAAEQRHTNAEAAVGRLLLRQYDDDMRQGNDSNASEAIHWLQRAAASGEHAEALTLLGIVFTDGQRGAKRDVDRGVTFLRRAVRAGSHDAMLRLAKVLLLSPLVSDVSSVAATHDREEAHDEALQLLLTAAQCKTLEGEANFEVGEQLYHSRLLRDRTAALRFYVRAAQTKTTPHAVAARRAATMVYSGVGCKQVDTTQAHRLYKIAADAGDAEALNALGLMYEDGEGCELDFQKAATCYRRAVELGDAHAHFNLGCLLAHGKGVPRNLDAAQAHFTKAVALGYALARDFLRPET